MKDAEDPDSSHDFGPRPYPAQACSAATKMHAYNFVGENKQRAPLLALDVGTLEAYFEANMKTSPASAPSSASTTSPGPCAPAPLPVPAHEITSFE